jgi:hypothetical protein
MQRAAADPVLAHVTRRLQQSCAPGAQHREPVQTDLVAGVESPAVPLPDVAPDCAFELPYRAPGLLDLPLPRPVP